MLFKNESEALAWLMAVGITVKFESVDTAHFTVPVTILTFEVASQEFSSYSNVTRKEEFLKIVNDFAVRFQVATAKESSNND